MIKKRMNGTSQSSMASGSSHKTWLWVLVLIVALVLIGLAFYFFYGSPAYAPSATTENANKLSGSQGADDVASLEKDLKAADVNNLDAEVKDIDKELQSK